MNPNKIRLPAWLQTLLWVTWPTKALDYFARHTDEPFTISFVGGREYVMVSHPDAVKELFAKFPDGGNEELRPFLGNDSMFVLRGDTHIRHRRLMQPSFAGKSLADHDGVVLDACKTAIAKLKPGQTIDVREFIYSITLDITCRVTFGPTKATETAEIKSLLLGLMKLVSGPEVFFPILQRDLGPGSPGRRMRRMLTRIDELIGSVIASKRLSGLPEGVQGEGVIASILARSTEESLSDKELIDEVKTILAAGYEPTAAALCWAMHFIHVDSDVLKRLRQEFEGSQDVETEAKDGRGNYLDAVCRETLRLMPVVPAVDRLVTVPTEFRGHVLQPGTRVVACAYLAHRRDDVYRDPLAYRPERFFENSYTPHQYFPFGGGGRRCLGSNLAMREMRIVLQEILSRVSFSPSPSMSRVSVVQTGTSLRPSNDNRLEVLQVSPERKLERRICAEVL